MCPCFYKERNPLGVAWADLVLWVWLVPFAAVDEGAELRCTSGAAR